MRETEVSVSFRPAGKEAFVLPGTRLLEAAACVGIVLETPCGGEGLCGKCRVRVTQAASPPTAAEQDHFSAAELQAGWRLACQTAVAGPTEVEIPPGSLVAASPQILVQTEPTALSVDDAPLVQKRYVAMPQPTQKADAADLLRLEETLQTGPLHVDLALLRELPSRLRELDFRGTAVLDDGQLIDFEQGDTTSDAFAVAVDIGTTTLAATLLDLGTGSEWATVSRLNPQTRFGDDVLSRILHAQTPAGLRQLQEAVCRGLDEMLGELCRQAGVSRNRIYAVSCAGNTTMQQLLCGVDCRSLGEVPFVAAGQRGLTFPAVDIGLQIHTRGRVHVLPIIGSFLGGDTVAGILATGLAAAERPTLFVDIGTNGEVVLLAHGKMLAASTAAGPAFEGARISCGMRGCAGAIEKVVIDDDGRLHANVIGNVAPVGLCGSGLIDVAAELLRHGLMTSTGRLLPREQLPDAAPAELRQRVLAEGQQAAFLLATAAESGNDAPLILTQRDLRELQLAAGAIRAGVAILLRQAGLQPADLDRVLIGGGFGNFIRRSNAQRIGLLPAAVAHRHIRYLGNTALAGAKLAAISRLARERAEELALCTRHVNLSTDATFHNTFADAMIFPDA